MSSLCGFPGDLPLLQTGVEPGCSYRVPIHSYFIVLPLSRLETGPVEGDLMPRREIGSVVRPCHTDAASGFGRVRVDVGVEVAVGAAVAVAFGTGVGLGVDVQVGVEVLSTCSSDTPSMGVTRGAGVSDGAGGGGA
jgi:hypothetical protein